jgi:hypothetical protein
VNVDALAVPALATTASTASATTPSNTPIFDLNRLPPQSTVRRDGRRRSLNVTAWPGGLTTFQLWLKLSLRTAVASAALISGTHASVQELGVA